MSNEVVMRTADRNEAAGATGKGEQQMWFS